MQSFLFPWARVPISSALLFFLLTSAQGATYYWHRNSVLTSSTDFSKAYNWTGNADGTGARPASASDDHFTSDALGGSWTFLDRATSAGAMSLTTNADQLTLSGQSKIWATDNSFEAIYRTDLTASFDVTVKVNSVTGSTYGAGGIMAADDFTNLGLGGYVYVAWRVDGKVEFEYDVSGNVGEMDTYVETGSAVTGPVWLRLVKNGTAFSGFYRNSVSNTWTQIGSAQTPLNTAANSQIAIFHQNYNTASTGTAVFDDFKAGVNMSATDNDLSFNGTGSNADANATLSTSQAVKSIDFTGYAGTFDFSTHTLTVNSGNATFVAGQTVTAGSGTLAFTAASGTQTFTPKSGATYPTLTKSGAGQVTVATSALTAGALTVSAGTWYWGASTLTHAVASIATSGSSTMTFGTNTVQVTSGNSDLSGLATLTANTGTLSFTGASGTQVFTPKSGQSHPHVSHTGASTLQLATADLSTLSFTQSAGILDFNGRNITTTSSGNFTLTNGTTTSFSNLGGRTLIVAGNASFTGQSGNLANLNPTSLWTIAATGTLTANYATVAYSTASVTTGAASNSVSGGANTNWNLSATDYSAWPYSRRILFNTTSSGANVSGNVTEFPLLVRLNANNFVFSQAQSDGRDIRFGDPDGARLYYHIERWDATNKVAEIWVKVPQVDGNSDRDYINFYWGNASAASESNGAGVFPSTLGYQGIWHLNESPGAGANGFVDASGNANHATAQSGVAGDSLTAVSAMGFKLNGSSKYVSSTTQFSNPSAFTVSCWFKTVSQSGGKIFGFGSSQTGLSNDYDRHAFMGTNGKINFGVNPSPMYQFESPAAYNDGAWHHLVGRLGTSGAVLFVDGVQVGSNTSATAGQNFSGYWKAGYDKCDGWTNSPGSVYFNGALDEFWVNHTQLSADFIKLSYQTQKPAATAVTHADTDLSLWTYSTKLYLNTTASGANITANQTNYPLLVRLTQANFNFSQANATGSDLRFADSSGNLLSYEVERFDATSKLAEVWVLIPTVKANNNAQWFKMYWGRGTAVSLSSATSVFQASNGYVGVWHLSEDGSTTANGYKDASNAENHGTGVNTTDASDVSALVGVGSNFTAASTQAVSIAHAASMRSNTNLTVELWSNSTSQGTYKRMFCKPFSSAAAPWNEYDIESSAASNTYAFSVSVSGTIQSVTTTTAMSNGTWYFATGTYDGTTLKAYHNGVLEGSLTAAGIVDNWGAAAAIGKYPHDATSNFDGKLDEVRISTVTRSADWVKLNYETMKSGSTVVTVGNRSPDYSKSVQLNFNTTNSGGGANVSGNVTNIPLLVRLTSSNFDFTAVRNDGTDIQFVDKNGANLYHEVVEWDKGNKVGKVWVKVPQVDGNSTADFITLYYGCSTCTGSPYAVKDSVWTGFNGVWHLRGDEDRAYDASSTGNHGTFANSIPFTTGLTTPLSPSFDGTSNLITLSNSTALDAEDMTVSFWVKSTATGTVDGNWWGSKWLFDRDASGSGNAGWALVLDNAGTSKLKFLARDDELLSASTIGSGTWRHVTVVKSTTNKYIYIDGLLDASEADAGVISNDEPLYFVSQNGTGSYIQAQMNEVSLAPTARSADFIKLSYENQKEGSTVVQTAITTSSFTSSKVYKFNTTASGANVSGDVYNFPLLIRIAGSTMVDAVQDNAPDIRFLDGDGVTWLDYQVARWNKTVDSAEVWVKVPKVDGNSAGDFITLYYNDVTNGAIPDGQCATCVFDVNNGFASVWHLDNSLSDATANAISGTNTGSTDGAGMVGSGRNFDGTDDYISFGNPDALKNISSAITVEAWLKTALSASTTQYSVIRHNGHYTVLQYDGASNVRTARWIPGATNSNWGNWNGNFDNDAWHHVVVQYDGLGGTKIWRDGAVHVSFNGTAGFLATNATANFMLGATESGTEDWTGRLDEVRVSGVYRDSNYIKLNYQSQRAVPTLFNPSPADFVSTKKYTFNTTRTGANVMADVESFPLLVRITGSALVDAVQDDFDDIRFLDGDGKTWLNYHVERWSKALDSAEVWVLVPKVDGNNDRDFITLYYDDVTNGAVANGECATCVFSTSNGFAAVWHLNNSLNDATSNANNGTNQGSVDGDGLSGSGRSFSGTAQYATFGNANSIKTIADYMAVEAWIKTSQAAGTAYKSVLRHDGHFTALQISSSAPNAMVTAWHTGQDSRTITWDGQFNTGEWIHYVGQYSKDDGYKVYKDGALYWSASTTGSLAATSTDLFSMGGTAAGGELYTGKLDEVRISNVVRDSNWYKLSYQTQRRAGNLFWNDRPGPNNKVTLTATPGAGAVSLAWTTPVSDSSNADSVGLWVKYSGTLDSVGATGQTKVVVLPKTDSAYSYPATYPGTYYFGLAVRNSSGKWSPFTATSIDTVLQSGNDEMIDTIYVDSAIGTTSGGTSASCTNARNPATPLAEIEDAVWCAQASGFTPNDTLVVRVLPGTYASSSDNELAAPSTYPVVVTAFDADSRPVLSSATHSGYTVQLGSLTTLRRMDIRAATNGAAGIQIKDNADTVIIDGCRIYNNGNTKHDTGIVVVIGSNEGVLLANNLIHQPNLYGVYVLSDDRTNIIGNTFSGSGATGTKGIYMPRDAWNAGYFTLTNNIFHNWDYGIHTTDANSEIGTVSNNLFHLVTTNREVVGETDAAKIVADPLFYSTDPGHRHSFKLLPGSPALEAGTSTINTLASESWPRVSYADHFGTARPQGSARDIGLYEGTGYTPNPTGDFDTLTNTVSGNTVIVKNSKWKLVWDMARGGGITGFYDMTGDSTANLVATSSLLFDVRLDAHLASTQTSNSIAPTFSERTRARSVIRQRLALSASLDLNVWYTVYASGQVYIQSEIVNLSGGALDVDVVQYNLKLASATAVTQSGGSLAGISYKNGFGYLTTSTKDAFLSVTQDLDTGAFGASETWTQVGSVAGSTDSIGFSIADMTDLAQNMKRHHHFLLYVGDGSLDFGKASTLNADARNPSPVVMSAGSLLHEKSWQDRLGGHWPLDEGAGTVAKDVSINYTNNSSAMTSATWVSGKVGGALRFTTASAVQVSDNDALEVHRHSTFMFWFKPDFTAMGSNATVISKGTSTSDGWYFKRIIGGNKIRFRVDGATADTPELTTNTWYHLAGTVGGSGQLHLYVNGVLVSASTANAAIAVNGSHLRFGENSGDNDKYAGDIDDVRIYHTGVPVGQLQAIVNRGFSTQYGHYHLRADNNNRVVALLNESVAQTRVQPAFEIDNWYGTKTPKYVYLNGTRLLPNVDFVVDSLVYGGIGAFGSNLILQVNKVLTGTSQTLFVDDNDSSGYMGEAAKMKSLTLSSVAGDKIVIKNFADTVFGSASSGQWYSEIDLNGGTSWNTQRVTDTGFGGFNSWKAAAISPNVAISSATQLAAIDSNSGRHILNMKFDNTSATLFGGASGYAGPATITYTLADSSSTRLSLTMANMSMQNSEGTFTLSKRWTVYPTGRIFASWTLSGQTFDLDDAAVDFHVRYNSGVSAIWSSTVSRDSARTGFMGGDLELHSIAGALLNVKNVAGNNTTGATMLGSASTSNTGQVNGKDYRRARLLILDALVTAANKPITVNFFVDISRDFTDAATADSLMRDIQKPATLTAITGSLVSPTDPLDFNADNFAEGDGAYVYTAGSGVAHFKFVNTVTHFNPAFRITGWSFSSVPEFVVLDNQTLTKNYHYNAYVNTGSTELILQFNKTLAPGTHLFYISHKTGLAVSLNHFEAVGGEGVDSLKWSTESEFENLGFHLYRRVAPIQDLPDSLFAGAERTPGAGIANALLENIRVQAAAKAAQSAADTASDTLPELSLSSEELKALGYVRINAKLIPGAKGGSSASTQSYQFIDRTAGFGTTYEYLLEAVDFSGTRVQYGPRKAKPSNPLETVLEPNYPNPFNPITTLRFSLKEKAKVSLVVYDARGRVVRTLIRPDKALLAGKYRLIWDARDDKGFEVPSGQYFYRFTAPKYHKTRKMILVK